MVKLICLTLGSLGSNKQIGISGKEYMFHQGSPTVVNDREDAESFLKSNNGEAFKKVNKIGEWVEDVKIALAEVAKELPGKKKEKKEEEKKMRDESKDVETDFDDTKLKEAAEKRAEEKPKDKKVEKIYTATEIKAENRKWQTEKIRELGGADVKIPTFESGKIKLILELQKKRGDA